VEGPLLKVHYCTNIFFFSSRRRHTRFSRDWSSDVCSSDLYLPSGYDGNADSPGLLVVRRITEVGPREITHHARQRLSHVAQCGLDLVALRREVGDLVLGLLGDALGVRLRVGEETLGLGLGIGDGLLGLPLGLGRGLLGVGVGLAALLLGAGLGGLGALLGVAGPVLGVGDELLRLGDGAGVALGLLALGLLLALGQLEVEGLEVLVALLL